jgi:predicted tellurium resistance membrane protein TerC
MAGRLTHDLFTLFGQGISVRDLVLILGGAFLLVKGTMEIRDLVVGEGVEEDIDTKPMTSFGMVIAQIAVIDIVFSLDSVIAAVGMANQTWIMVCAILLAVAVMLLAAGPLGRFIDLQPTIKMLALAFISWSASTWCWKASRCTFRRATSTARWASRRWSNG